MARRHLPNRALRLLTTSSLLIALVGVPHTVVAENPLGLSGTWLRDEAASDDLRELAKGFRPKTGLQHGPRGGAGTGGPRGGLGRGPGTGAPDPGSALGDGAPDAGKRFDRLARAIEVLQVTEQEKTLTIKNGVRETRVLLLDGSTVGDGLGTRTRARRSGAELVIETEGDEARAVETWRLEGDRLVVTTDLSGGRLPELSYRTVYEKIGDAPSDPVTVPAAPRRESATLVPDAAGPEAAAAGTAGSRSAGATPAGRPGGSDDDSARRGAIDRATAEPAVIRLLPPEHAPGEMLTGKILLQTLAIASELVAVEFTLDGERVARRTTPPFETRIELASPPREQTVRAVGYDATGARLGADELVLNRYDPPFRVHISAIRGRPEGGSVRVEASVSVPRRAQLERVEVYRRDQKIATLESAEIAVDVPTADLTPTDFVRVLATLRDGRQLEDVELIRGGDFTEEVDVQLVQLQVLVTDKAGRPVTGLEPEDFEITDGGVVRPVERLYPSRDVALVLGLAIDTSGSMGPLWAQTRQATQQFLDTTLSERDRAFVVSFDTALRLLQPVTGERSALRRAFDRLEPGGATALYDSILFSLLQFQDEPGRRALIVFSDGFDSSSRADPKRAIDFGRRLGVPVYVIAMSARGQGFVAGRRGARSGPAISGAMTEGLARANLRLITEPTGGRLFQVLNAGQAEAAFQQIRDELLMQYVLTYTTDRGDGAVARPVIRMRRKGLKVKAALPIDLVQ